ncbi:hypothetical protein METBISCDRAFT_16513 [Metschnikowia bicuspidata]|uniref:4-hydroxy-3-methoxy-5-polyprenylbenzoate decarboxylase n=1 Tax=Metschnikowia bicuspidata TaxID=27322 RepID=A0A4P9ZBZ8_9ASCO|nr:hypothetical protein METBISCDRAFT_16513 [Metschnikowia bicuspidata]
MLSVSGVRALTHRRPFGFSVLATAMISFIFNENNRLASQMEAGKLHYRDANAPLDTRPAEGYFKRAEPEYPGHVPLSNVGKLMMLAGSGIGAYFHPERNEFIVGLGELTAFKPVLRRLQKQMLSDPVGRQILKKQPRITSTSLDLDYLRSLPPDTIGNTYVKWLEKEGVSPDTRVPVRYIDDAELAYIYQRYRECHDFYHSITGLPIIIEGEIAVKVLEFMNIGMPMPGLGALFAPFRLRRHQKERLCSVYYPWAIKSGLQSKPLINVYWENILEYNVHEFRRKMGIEQPPDLRAMRREYFSAKKMEKSVKTAV